jgi:hypothetical protein
MRCIMVTATITALQPYSATCSTATTVHKRHANPDCTVLGRVSTDYMLLFRRVPTVHKYAKSTYISYGYSIPYD